MKDKLILILNLLYEWDKYTEILNMSNERIK